MHAASIVKQDSHIYDVYAQQYGWRMFSNAFLTSEIADFLTCEQAILANILQDFQDNMLVEVGCGYGRYMVQCESLLVPYCGIDLIGWFIDMAKWRMKALGTKKSVAYQASVMDIMNIPDVVSLHKGEPVVFFPFNCLGNLPYIRDVLALLGRNNISFICSVFNSDAQTSQMRQAYYTQCGFKNFQVMSHESGTDMNLGNGFTTKGFNTLYLRELLTQYGYEIYDEQPINTLGSVMYCKVKHLNADVPPAIHAQHVAHTTHHVPLLQNVVYEDDPAEITCYAFNESAQDNVHQPLLNFTEIYAGEMLRGANMLPDATCCPIGVMEKQRDGNFSAMGVRWS